MSSSFGLILWFTCLNILSIVGNRHQNFPVWLLSLRKYESSKNKRTHNLLKIKGGATALSEILKSNGDINNNAKSTSSEEVVPNLTGNVTVTVTTSIGSSFLDKIKRLSISRNASILELKQSIRDKFPGNPPMQLQRLFYGFRILGNHSQKVGELTTSPQVPILLDMLSGTSGYNKTMSISQAVEAYVAVQVHHTYLSLAMQKVFNSRETITENELKPSSTTTTTTTEGAVTGATTSSSPEQQTEQNKLESLTLREIFDVVNRSVYEQYGEEIALALEREKEPEMIAGDTIAWRRGSALSERNPLQSAWAKQFDTNKQVALALVYYSVILVIFSKYATSSKDSKVFLICMIPLLWVAKLRQFRVTFKLLINLLLQIAPYVDFIMPLLPAPYQAIATASKKWDWASTEEPIVPRKKTHSSGTIADVEEESFNEQDEEDDDEDGDDETKIDSKIAEKIVKSGETNDNKLSSKNISENEDDESEDEMEFNDDTDYDNEDEDEDEE